MQIRTTILVSISIVAAVLGSAWANLSLKSTMRSWKSEVSSLERMLAGASVFDEAEAARILQTLVADSRALAARVRSGSAQAQDVKARFEKFSSDAEAALAVVATRDAMKARYSQLRAECRSCHDVYAN